MKVNTEWRLGVLAFSCVLAFVCNFLLGTTMIFTMLSGITISDINTSAVLCLFLVYLVSFCFVLFHFWVGKEGLRKG